MFYLLFSLFCPVDVHLMSLLGTDEKHMSDQSKPIL